jgi:hypothetical protein
VGIWMALVMADAQGSASEVIVQLPPTSEAAQKGALTSP